MYRSSHGIHVPPIQRLSARPRSVMPQGARSQVARPRGGCAWGVHVEIEMILDLVVVALAFTPLVDHVFLVVIIFSPAGHVFPFVVIALIFVLG
jgi:hypothetical protein